MNEQIENPRTFGECSDKFIKAAIGPINNRYYLRTFKLFSCGYSPSWNWSVLFFGPFWFIFRKIPSFFFFVFFSLGLISRHVIFRASSHFMIAPLGYFIVILYIVIMPATANYVYYKYILWYINKLIKKGISEEEIIQKIERRFRTIHDKNEVDRCLFPDRHTIRRRKGHL